MENWSIVWEDRIGVICVMVHSCWDSFGIIEISISYDSCYSRIRVNVSFNGSVVDRVRRGGRPCRHILTQYQWRHHPLRGCMTCCPCSCTYHYPQIS